MAKVKKFGTFSGVFTPSILTILGVIMYLRFPTIIGQAGLINTIGIIVIAHIISITTSLSVASLSTDKTVKTGGTYFMISRSLGLPIGGTLGLALFVGLSFSVSLYLIGFAESFLTYWNLDTSINSIRIAGTAILVVVTTITFISTSLAIKSQYFIMAAIGLSLLSIFFGNHEFTPKEIHLKPLADAAPFMVLFGIFFPAVTGFEAGVSMSGDLKNAKKSLPVGAMAAVGVGFVVYLGLALFYALTVDAEVLRSDSQVLFKIALVPALVIVGIWGATLSSALGSILGAPRILQAIAMDKIAPKVFAKGTGKTNEPRNALLFAFIIAESGILIGELDVIARIVSMFFITTYAFLNLASAIESWSSSDFRPAFKIPRFVSVLGATAAFIVMILLDFVALAGAVIVLGLLFFFLKRKELVLESGDAWSSFWTNLAKRALLKLSVGKTENRNWRPNVVLFSGGKQARPHLVELGLALTGKLGALTDFELILDSNPYSHTGMKQPASKKVEDTHFFKRQFVCSSIEDGIKTVTNVYGFSGFEPNTIMMGWSRDTKNAELLANVLTHLKRKNMNAVFLDYDKNAGFGKKQNIDIWWNGKGRHLSFALNIMRFILADTDWRDANLRILIINSDNRLTDKLYKNTSTLLEEKRIEAEVKIINDDFGTRSKETIINSESANADLIVLGISPKSSSYTGKYISSISQITNLPSSILVLSPSEEFEEVNILSVPEKRKDELPRRILKELKPVPVIENKIVKNRIDKLDEELMSFTNDFVDRTINESVLYLTKLIEVFKVYFESNIGNVEKARETYKGIQLEKIVNKFHQSFFEFCFNLFEKKGKTTLDEIRGTLSRGISSLHSKTGNYIYETSETIIVQIQQPNTGKEKNVTVQYRKLVEWVINTKLIPEIADQFKTFENKTAKLYSGFKNIVLQVNDIYLKQNLKGKNDGVELKQHILSSFAGMELELQNLSIDIKSGLLNLVRNQVIEIEGELTAYDLRDRIKKRLREKPACNIEDLTTFPEDWISNTTLLNNGLILDVQVLSEQKIIAGILENFNEKMRLGYSEKVLNSINTIIKNIDKAIDDISSKMGKVIFNDNIDVRFLFQETYYKISEILERLPEEIEISEFTYMEGESDYADYYSTSVVEPYKIARYYFDTRLYEPLYRELEQIDGMVKQIIGECKEANSLLRFRLDNAQQNKKENIQEDQNLVVFLDSLKKQVLKEKNKLLEAIDRVQFKSEELLKNAVSPVYSHSIIQAEKKISSMVRDQKGRRIGLKFSQRIKSVNKSITRIILGLLYSSSGGVIQARKILKKKPTIKTGVSSILDIAEKVMPDRKILSQIPVFYRTLFSSKSLINDDFWVAMDKEITEIKNAWSRHRNGYGGAVLITGAHGSGKTALTRYCTNHLFKKDRIYNIIAPLEGSVKKEDWLLAFQTATGQQGNSADILRNLLPESTIVINDLELWWERSNSGYDVLSEIIDLIQVFGRKTFFIINCNLYSYKLINKILALEENFISVIECLPFNARKLQSLIQNRHKSSGLTYFYKNKDEEELSQITTAALFNSFFTVSDGIPGVAMNVWLGSITSVAGNNIHIKKPETPNTEILFHITDDWLIIIALFIQHKNMNSTKLARVMKSSEDDAEKIITNLANAGILDHRENRIFTMARYLEPFLVKVCLEKGII